MKTEEFNNLLSIYKKHNDSIRLKNSADQPTLQESIWAYSFESEFYIAALRVLAAAVYEAKADSVPFANIDLNMINRMTAEQIYKACQLLLALKQDDIKNICSNQTVLFQSSIINFK